MAGLRESVEPEACAVNAQLIFIRKTSEGETPK
jgi:hypothetical protein